MNQSVESVIRQLFQTQKLAVLSTQKDGHPYASLVAFAAGSDLKTLYFATTRATRKYANITDTPRAALLVDSRSNAVTDFEDAAAVTAVGQVREVEPDERAAALNLYLDKHPNLTSFADSPTSALLKIQVERYSLVQRFQNVTDMAVE